MFILEFEDKNEIVLKQYVFIDDVESFLSIHELKHQFNKTTGKLSTYFSDKKIEEINLDKNSSVLDIKEKLSNIDFSSSIKKAIAGAVIVSASFSGLYAQADIQTNFSFDKSVNKVLEEKIADTLEEANELAYHFTKDNLSQKMSTSIDDIKKIKVNLSYSDAGTSIPIVTGNYSLRNQEVSLVLNKQAIEIANNDEINEIVKMLKNLSLHEMQHAYTDQTGMMPLEKYAVDAQQKLGEKIDPNKFTDKVKVYQDSFFKTNTTLKLNILYSHIQEAYSENRIDSKKKEMFENMRIDIDETIQKRDENNFRFQGKREYDVNTVPYGEYLSTTLGDDFNELVSDMNEHKQFIYSRLSSFDFHFIPIALAKTGKYTSEEILDFMEISNQSTFLALSTKQESFYSGLFNEVYSEMNSDFSDYIRLLKNQIEDEIEKNEKNTSFFSSIDTDTHENFLLQRY